MCRYTRNDSFFAELIATITRRGVVSNGQFLASFVWQITIPLLVGK